MGVYDNSHRAAETAYLLKLCSECAKRTTQLSPVRKCWVSRQSSDCRRHGPGANNGAKTKGGRQARLSDYARATHYINSSLVCRIIGCCRSCRSFFTWLSPYTQLSKLRESLANNGATFLYSKCSKRETM